eukprot:5106651-Alexandrium_andersonii.AAC.1
MCIRDSACRCRSRRCCPRTPGAAPRTPGPGQQRSASGPLQRPSRSWLTQPLRNSKRWSFASWARALWRVARAAMHLRMWAAGCASNPRSRCPHKPE